MTYVPTIHEWPTECEALNQVFVAGGQEIPGGVTLGGVTLTNPEPGGRGELILDFPTFVSDDALRLASWLITRLRNGSVFRYDLLETPQLVPEAELSVPRTAPVNANAALGATSIEIDMSTQGQILKVGHLIGFNYDSGAWGATHAVLGISYDGSDIATVEISPPLRRATTTSDVARFRPAMLMQCINPREVLSTYRWGRHIQLGQARFIEALY